jgi:hypothetical protein
MDNTDHEQSLMLLLRSINDEKSPTLRKKQGEEYSLIIELNKRGLVYESHRTGMSWVGYFFLTPVGKECLSGWMSING